MIAQGGLCFCAADTSRWSPLEPWTNAGTRLSMTPCLFSCQLKPRARKKHCSVPATMKLQGSKRSLHGGLHENAHDPHLLGHLQEEICDLPKTVIFENSRLSEAFDVQVHRAWQSSKLSRSTKRTNAHEPGQTHAKHSALTS